MSALIWHLLSWFSLLVLAMINGTARVLLYDKYLGAAPGRVLASFIGLALFATLTAMLHRWKPLESVQQAWLVGAVWTVLTMIFEFSMGRYNNQMSTRALIAMYDPTTGSLWLLVILGTLLLPPLFYWVGRMP